MVKKCICFLLILTILLFTLTGCYDANGLEQFYYIVAIGIDKSKDGLISLSIQNAKSSSSSNSSSGSSSGGSSQSTEYKIYSVDCTSIETGINILNNYLNKKINLSHCSAIVFSEEIAKEGIQSYINTLGNDTEIRPSCNVIISSKSAYDLMDSVSNSGESFSSRLYEYILSSVDYTGYTVDSTFNNFFSKLNSDGTQATAIYSILGEDTVQNAGTAIFKHDKMVGTISPLQTIAHLIINNNLEACMLSIDSPFKENAKIELNVKKINSPYVSVSLNNNKPVIKINLSIQANIDSSGEEFDYTNWDNVKTLEDSSNKYIYNLLTDYLETITRKYDSDIIGFGGKLSSKYLTVDDFNKVNWDNIFKESMFSINVETKITSSHLFNKE